MNVRFKVFTSMTMSWENLFAEAGAFATEVGPERLIGISHSHQGTAGVVTVWYWTDDPPSGQSWGR